MKYCVYTYVFPDGMTYVGLTCNPHKRNKEHLRKTKSAVFRHHIATGLSIPEMSVLTEMLEGPVAQQVEHDTLMAVPAENRINKAPTGRGTGSLGWTKKRMTPDLIKAWFRDYWARNKEKLSAAGKVYYQQHREERLAYQRRYKAANREKVLAAKRENYKKHREHYREANHRRYLKNKALGLIKRNRGPQPYNPEYYRKNKDKFRDRKRRWKNRCKLRKIFGQQQTKLLTYTPQPK